MDCRGVQHYAGDAIDRALPSQVEEEFRAHLDRCRPCRNEVAMEKLSKHLVRQYVTWVPTPRTVRTLVLTALYRERPSQHSLLNTWFGNMLTFRLMGPAVLGGAAAAAFFMMTNRPLPSSDSFTAHTAHNDIIHRSLDNFARVKAGQFIPAMTAVSPRLVADFFQSRAMNFSVHLPDIRGCDWCGVFATDEGGIQEAHLVCRVAGELVYVYEVSERSGAVGNVFTMPLAARAALDRSGQYTDPSHPECRLVVWKTNEAICVAVSTLEKRELLALLPASSK